MERRYQVFVSSTYQDLVAERQEVMQALLELDCMPAGMELFPASDDDKWTLIQRVIDDSDYYIVVVGGRYGSLDAAGISYTEREYDYAVASGKPVMAFVHKDPDVIPVGKSELNPEARNKLDAFRATVEQRMCKYWLTAEELGAVVSRSLVKLLRSHPAEGWIRSVDAVTPETLAEINSLYSRVQELEVELNTAKTTAPPGTERLSRGHERFTLRYEIRDLRQRETGRAKKSWDEIFYLIGPLMLVESSENQLKVYLAGQVLSGMREAGELKGWHLDYTSLDINDDDFQQVKIQLVALGLIQRSAKKHTVTDKGTYWSLTPYGETYLMRLRALPSQDG